MHLFSCGYHVLLSLSYFRTWNFEHPSILLFCLTRDIRMLSSFMNQPKSNIYLGNMYLRWNLVYQVIFFQFQMFFGDDGYLYMSMADGSPQGDKNGNALNRLSRPQRKNPKRNVTTQKCHTNFDFTTIAKWLRPVSLGYDSHPTRVIKAILRDFPLTAKSVYSKAYM